MATAVLIANMGGPDSVESVLPYLENFFRDPAIIDIPLPGILRGRFARWLASRRAPKSASIYEKIGGKTPLTDITRKQAEHLEACLNASQSDEYHVFPAMRYWHPLIEDVWNDIVLGGFGKLIVLPLYPFYSYSTTGSLIDKVMRLNANNRFSKDNLKIIDRFGDHPAFNSAVAEQIKNAANKAGQRGEEKHVIMSAHSIPMRLIRKGDPYRSEIERSFESIREQMPADIILHLSYQSKLGPVKWLGPNTSEKIDELAGMGIKILFIYPFGFVAENSETIFEIGMLFKEQALAGGIRHFHRIDALNADESFIDALRRIIEENIREAN